MWQHSENDTFVFYEKLIGATGLAELQKNFEEAALPVKNELEKIRYFKQFSANEAKENMKGLDSQIANQKKRKSKFLIIEEAVSKIDYYLKKISELTKTNEKYPFFISDLKKLRTELTVKYAFLMPSNIPVKEKNITKPQSEELKIKWTGGAAALATMFCELYTEYKNPDDGSFYIKATKRELADFLFTHFTDAKGNPFIKGTLSKYLDPENYKKSKTGKIVVESMKFKNSLP